MIGKTLRGTLVSIVTSTFILVLIHLIAFIEGGVLSKYFTMYYGKSIDIYTIVTWLLVINSSAMRISNYLSVLLAWTIAWYVSGEWVRDRKSIGLASIVSFLLLILYLAAWRHASIIIYVPESLAIFYGAVISESFLYLKEKVARKPTFFELLEREGYKLSESEKRRIEVPLKCHNCGSLLYSSSQFCWKCGEKIL